NPEPTTQGRRVQISLNAGSSNTIELSGDGHAAAPTFDSIAIEKSPPGEVIAGPGLNLSVPDDGYDDTLASMTCVDLVSTMPGTVDSVSASIAMTHPYVGDLTFKLKSPAGTVVTLMSRPGAAETSDNGADTPAGDSSDLQNAWPVVFE